MDTKTHRRAARILVIDDDPLVRQMLLTALSGPTRQILAATTLSEARAILAQHRPDLIILDHILPDGHGLALLEELSTKNERIPVLLVTADIGSHTALEAMKRGAFDYLTKPLDLGAVEKQVALALEACRLMRLPVVVSPAAESLDDVSEVLVGKSPQMAEVFKAMGRAAARDVPVVLMGEVGTGKALIAKAIVQKSERATGPFLSINCGDTAPEMLEGELFGSMNHPVGRLEQCQGGTLLLEDVGDLPIAVQGRLHQVLTTRLLPKRENDLPPELNVRVMVTTSIPLEDLVAAGSFRPELYYHLRTITIPLPPLRERGADLPALVDHFVQRFGRLSIKWNVPAARVSQEAMELLAAYSWPGNLDELQSVIRQSLVENAGTVLASESLERLVRSTSVTYVVSQTGSPVTDWATFVTSRINSESTTLYSEALEEMERYVIALALSATHGNQAQAARRLGITRGSLRRKIRLLGLLGKSAEADADEEVNEEFFTAEPSE